MGENGPEQKAKRYGRKMSSNADDARVIERYF